MGGDDDDGAGLVVVGGEDDGGAEPGVAVGFGVGLLVAGLGMGSSL